MILLLVEAMVLPFLTGHHHMLTIVTLDSELRVGSPARPRGSFGRRCDHIGITIERIGKKTDGAWTIR